MRDPRGGHDDGPAGQQTARYVEGTLLGAEANTHAALATSVGCIKATVPHRMAAHQRAGWWYHPV
jgi:hypothetical protein